MSVDQAMAQHGYTALESNERLIAEMIKWFDKHVKNAAPRDPAAAKRGEL